MVWYTYNQTINLSRFLLRIGCSLIPRNHIKSGIALYLLTFALSCEQASTSGNNAVCSECSRGGFQLTGKVETGGSDSAGIKNATVQCIDFFSADSITGSHNGRAIVSKTDFAITDSSGTYSFCACGNIYKLDSLYVILLASVNARLPHLDTLSIPLPAETDFHPIKFPPMYLE